MNVGVLNNVIASLKTCAFTFISTIHFLVLYSQQETVTRGVINPNINPNPIATTYPLPTQSGFPYGGSNIYVGSANVGGGTYMGSAPIGSAGVSVYGGGGGGRVGYVAGTCQCDQACQRYNDCCSDYYSICTNQAPPPPLVNPIAYPNPVNPIVYPNPIPPTYPNPIVYPSRNPIY